MWVEQMDSMSAVECWGHTTKQSILIMLRFSVQQEGVALFGTWDGLQGEWSGLHFVRPAAAECPLLA